MPEKVGTSAASSLFGTTIPNRKLCILLAAIAVVVVFASATHHGQGPMLGSLDTTIFRTINQDMQNPALNSLAAAASDIGSDNLRLYLIMAAIILVTLLMSLIYDRRELKRLGVILLVALLASLLVIGVLKPVFSVSRPYIYLNDVHVYNGVWSTSSNASPMGEDLRDSFPSGHAVFAFTVLGVLWIYKRLRIPLLVFLFLIMFLIVYVGQHYISDIIAGGIIGFAIGYSARYLLYRQITAATPVFTHKMFASVAKNINLH